jgi:hypothetical protein
MQHQLCFAVPLGELKFKYANGGKIKKSFNHPRSLCSTRRINPNHFQADLIWCDSTFKWHQIGRFINKDKFYTKAQQSILFSCQDPLERIQFEK